MDTVSADWFGQAASHLGGTRDWFTLPLRTPANLSNWSDHYTYAMLAGQFTAPRVLQFIEVDEPTLSSAESGQIIFQPEMTCLCGSDLPFFDGDFEGHDIPYPQPPGMSLHEMVGTSSKRTVSVGNLAREF